MTISLVFLISALILFIVAAVGLAAGRVNLIAAGLACWIAAELAGHFR